MSHWGVDDPYRSAAPRAGFGPVPPSRWPAGFIVTLVLLTLLGGALGLLFSFGMLFATDSCGTGAEGSAAVCAPGGWLLLVALPWVGLAGALLVALLGGAWLRRRQLSPWRAMPVAAAVYLAAGAAIWLTLSG